MSGDPKDTSKQSKWRRRWQQYNPFSVTNVWNSVKAIGRTTINTLKKLWNIGEEESWISRIGLFLPRVLGTIAVGAVTAVATTITAGIGAITAGIIGGGVQIIYGVSQTVVGLLAMPIGLSMSIANGTPPKFMDAATKLLLPSGPKNIAIGILKVVGGSIISGSIAAAVITGVGTPAIAAIAPLSIAGQSLSFLTTLTPAVAAGHTFLVGAGTTIASTASTAMGAMLANNIVLASVTSTVGIVTGLGIIDKVKSIFKKKKKKLTVLPEETEEPEAEELKKDDTSPDNQVKFSILPDCTSLGANTVIATSTPQLKTMSPSGSTATSSITFEEWKQCLYENQNDIKSKTTFIATEPTVNNGNTIAEITTSDSKKRLLASIKEQGSSMECPLIKPRIGKPTLIREQQQLLMEFIKKHSDLNNPPIIEVSNFSANNLKILLKALNKHDQPIFVTLKLPEQSNCTYSSTEYQQLNKEIKKINSAMEIMIPQYNRLNTTERASKYHMRS